jgi:hypothetical protein
VYDAALEASAQAWADKCIWAHSVRSTHRSHPLLTGSCYIVHRSRLWVSIPAHHGAPLDAHTLLVQRLQAASTLGVCGDIWLLAGCAVTAACRVAWHVSKVHTTHGLSGAWLVVAGHAWRRGEPVRGAHVVDLFACPGTSAHGLRPL